MLKLLALNTVPYVTVKITTTKPLQNGRLFEFLIPLGGNAVKYSITHTDICSVYRKEKLTMWGKPCLNINTE